MSARRARLEIYPRTEVTRDQQHRRYGWRLVAANGQIIAGDQGQGYERRDECARMALAIVGGEYQQAAKDLLAAVEDPQ